MFSRLHKVIILAFVIHLVLPTGVFANNSNKPKNIVIIGAGHVGLIEAYNSIQNAKESHEDFRIIILEKNANIHQTTAANVWNSHTPDEIVSVVPKGRELAEKLKIPFNQPGGIRVRDVKGVNDSLLTKNFLNEVEIYGENYASHIKRTDALLKMGKAAMMLWRDTYENADNKLAAILQDSNFNRCSKIADNEMALHKGYRIDLVYDMSNAIEHAKSMVENYRNLGYKNSRLLSPDEVISIDSSLVQFVNQNSVLNNEKREWKSDSVALWRPGGCIDTERFIPKFADYLKDIAGTYIKADGTKANRFEIMFNTKVSGVVFAKDASGYLSINGIKYEDVNRNTKSLEFENAEYIFCPGEAVGTLRKFLFSEPAYAAFAGTSLSLTIDNFDLKEFKSHNHCMEVHKEGVVLAWQSRIRDGKFFLGTAGTKAYYGDKTPSIHEEFAKDRNLLQLQIMNEVLPNIVSLALNRNTTGETLTERDLKELEKTKIAKRWVGKRAVVYDGFPTLGKLYHNDILVSNARVTTHLGSGGGSFALISSLISRASSEDKAMKRLQNLGLDQSFIQQVLYFADSRRVASH